MRSVGTHNVKFICNHSKILNRQQAIKHNVCRALQKYRDGQCHKDIGTEKQIQCNAVSILSINQALLGGGSYNFGFANLKLLEVDFRKRIFISFRKEFFKYIFFSK